MSRTLVEVLGRATLLLALAQTTTSKPSLEVARLEPPAYPPIAMAARVSGDVVLKFTLLSTGSAGNVQVVSGPQMLRQAAVDSATRSRFVPAPADETYQLVYRFALEKALACGQERDKSYPHIHYEANTVTVSEQPTSICDPAAETEPTRVRSVKCLFLWKCGLK
ncbi:MAG: energy transducer TonB [Silvibacterium sp.]|nr:energy transducer TonB [Silvibacterium sp.]